MDFFRAYQLINKYESGKELTQFELTELASYMLTKFIVEPTYQIIVESMKNELDKLVEEGKLDVDSRGIYRIAGRKSESIIDKSGVIRVKPDFDQLKTVFNTEKWKGKLEYERSISESQLLNLDELMGLHLSTGNLFLTCQKCLRSFPGKETCIHIDQNREMYTQEYTNGKRVVVIDCFDCSNELYRVAMGTPMVIGDKRYMPKVTTEYLDLIAKEKVKI